MNEAINEYNKVLDINPDYYIASVNKSSILETIGKR